MIDLMKIRTYDFPTVQMVWEYVHSQAYHQTINKSFQKEFTKNGITILFQKEEMGEAVYFTFSPHKQMNGNRHNANSFSLAQAQKTIVKILADFGIEFSQFSTFQVTRLEVGVNYKTTLDSDIVLSSFLMLRTAFFETHEKYEHYKYANSTYRTNSRTKKRTPNLVMKHYLKDLQDYGNGKTNAEMGYCEPEVIRTEMKTERAGRVKDIGFEKLSDLYRDNALECCEKFLINKLDYVFVFNPQEIDKSNLITKTQLKHFYQMTTPYYWRNFLTDVPKNFGKKERELFKKKQNTALNRAKDNWNKLPKKYNTKEIIIEAIKTAIKTQNSAEFVSKSCGEIHPRETDGKNIGNSTNEGALQKFLNFYYSIDVVNSDTFYCVITGEDISMQRAGRPYLKRDGLKALKIRNPRRFLQIRDKFLPTDFLKQSEYKQLERIEKNIKNRYNNEKHKKISMIKRNYHEHQPQLFKFENQPNNQ